MPLAETRPPPARSPLLPRIRQLFLGLALLLLAVEVLEVLDADTPVWPQLSVAVAGLVAACGVIAVVRHRQRLTVTADVAMALALTATGWGIGRVGGVLSMLLGLALLRVLHNRRRSAATGVVLLFGGYVGVAVLLEGWVGLLDLHFVVVACALGAFAASIRQVAEVVARHDVDASLDGELATLVDRLHAATRPDEVDEVVDVAAARLDAAARDVAPDLIPVPSVVVVARQHGVVGTDSDLAVGMRARLSRIRTDATFARRLLRSEARFRRLAEGSRDGIYLRRAGDPTCFPYANEACRQLLGQLDHPDSHGIDLMRIVPEDRLPLLDVLGSRDGATRPVQLRLGDDDAPGGTRWVELCEAPAEVEAGIVVTLQGTVRDITDARRRARALEEALEREQRAARHLREIDQLRTTFLSAVGHELRTPMAGLIGAAQTIAARAERLPADRAAALAGIVDRQTTRLTRLLDDLLDVERLLRGKLDARPEPTSLLLLARRVVANSSDATGRVQVRGDDVVLDVDPELIERVLRNLLHNAVQHTPSTAAVRVLVEDHPHGAVLVVEDDGPGIPEGLRDGVFTPFVHGPSGAASPSPGVGIGLSLVRRIAELHGGRAWVEESASGGARMVVLLAGLPAGRAAAPVASLPTVVGRPRSGRVQDASRSVPR